MSETRRERFTDADGAARIRSTCSEGHVYVAPDKGIGRANVAAWETRHQHEASAALNRQLSDLVEQIKGGPR